MSRPSSTAVSVRLVLLGGCVWLLGSWAMVLILSPGGILSANRGGAQWMAVAAMAGLTLAWPAARLAEGFASDDAEGRASRAVPARPTPGSDSDNSPSRGARVGVLLADWIGLNGALQAVFWPLLLTADWKWEQAACLAGGAAAWSLAVASIVAMGRLGRGELIRTGAMLLVLAVVLGPLFAEALPPGFEVSLGPLQLAYHATDFGASAAGWQANLHTSLGVAIALGVFGWLIVGLALLLGTDRQDGSVSRPSAESNVTPS